MIFKNFTYIFVFLFCFVLLCCAPPPKVEMDVEKIRKAIEESNLKFGEAGPTGPKGDTGATGPAGPTLGIYDSLGLVSSGGRSPGNAGGKTLYNLGKVGIGTTSPEHKLDVSGNANISGRLRVGGSTEGSAWKVGISGNIIHNGGGTNSALALDINDKVGIGTTSPAEKLEVAGTVKASAFVGDGSGLTGVGLTLPYSGTTSIRSTLFSITNKGAGRAGLFQINNSNSDGTALLVRTNGTGAAGRFRIENSNNIGNAIYAYTNGMGIAGKFVIHNSSSYGSVLYATTYGLGEAGWFETTNTDNTAPALYAKSAGGIAGKFDGNLAIDGNVSIGTASPKNKLDVEGGAVIGAAYSGTNNAPSNGLLVEGNVGIGTMEPRSKLTVQGSGRWVISCTNTNAGMAGSAITALIPEGSGPGIAGLFMAHSGTAIMAYTGGDDKEAINAEATGNNSTGIKVSGDTAIEAHGKVRILGNLSIEDQFGKPLIELGEGLDFAEGFDVVAKEDIGPGSVLIIDPHNPGKLTISDKPYDSKVAGIVSGANNLGSAVCVGGQFDYDVALAGRVYCNVDATEAGIEPGDLLTTSTTPGYAMKAIDYDRARGAILGKAMEKLEKGEKGQILILVTLQ